MERDPIMAYGDDVAVVTGTWAAAAPLDRLLGSLAGATSRPVRVVVADTAGPAGSVGLPAGSRGLGGLDGLGGLGVPGGLGGLGVDVVRLGEALGRGAAVNRVVAGLDPDVGWVAVTDPGVQWCPGSLDVLLAAAVRWPRAAILGPRLLAAEGGVVPSAGPLPSRLDVRRGRIATAPDGGQVGWVAGACFLLRRAAWESVDGIDPRYRGGGCRVDLADVDLGDRLGRAGWLVVHEPAAEVRLGPFAGADGAQGILESHGDGLRRYLTDRSAGVVRAVLTLGVRGRSI